MENQQEFLRQLTQQRKEKLKGLSPRDRFIEKLNLVMQWTYNFGFISSKTIRILTDTKDSFRFEKTLVSSLLFDKISLNDYAPTGMPNCIYRLTHNGLIEAFENGLVSVDVGYRVGSRFVNLQNLKHDEVTQRIVAKLLKDDFSYSTDKMLMAELESMGKFVKIPDAVLITDKGIKVAFEVELTPKYKNKLGSFIYGINQALKHNHYNRFYIFYNMDCIAENYAKLLQPNQKNQFSYKDKNNNTETKRYSTISDLDRRVSFRKISTLGVL